MSCYNFVPLLKNVIQTEYSSNVLWLSNQRQIVSDCKSQQTEVSFEVPISEDFSLNGILSDECFSIPIFLDKNMNLLAEWTINSL